MDNARKKAEAAVRRTALPSLAEDAGLEVPVLGGWPGIRSARFAGPAATPDDRIQALLTALGDRIDALAFFKCAAVVAFPDGRRFEGEGVLEGRIGREPKAGPWGFGYNPIFVLPDGRHLAELSLEEKNLVSHRARAIAGLEVRGAFDAVVGT